MLRMTPYEEARAAETRRKLRESVVGSYIEGAKMIAERIARSIRKAA